MWSSNFGPPKKCNPQYAAACLTTGWAFTPEQSFSLSLADIASLTTSSCATVPATTLSDGPDSCWSNASIHLPTPGLAHFSPGQIYSSLKDLVPVCCKPLPSRKYVDPPHIKECRVPSLCTTIPERKRLSVQIFQLRKLARQHWHRTIVREAACGNWVAAATSSSSSLGSSHQAPHWSTWRWSFCGSGFGTPTLPKQILFRSPQCFPRWPGIPPQWSWWGVGGPPTQKGFGWPTWPVSSHCLWRSPLENPCRISHGQNRK